MQLKSLIHCAALAPLLIAAANPVRLQPSSPWDLDYAENSCRLLRTFGEGKTLTTLVLESSAPGRMDMLVTGKPLRTSEEKVVARFLPARGPTFDGNVAETVTKGDPAIYWPSARLWPTELIDQDEKGSDERGDKPGVRPPAADPAELEAYKTKPQEFAEATTEVEIQTRRDRPVILETGSFGEAMKAFDQCSRDSLKDWGVDPALQERIVRPVWTLNPGGWLSANDYPRDMVWKGKEAQLSVRLLINAAGRVTSCTPLSHYAEAEFGKISCDRITERARFAPAELADGTKVPSYLVRQIVFRIAP